MNTLPSEAILTNHKRKPVSDAFGELLKKSGLGLNEIERRTDGRLSHSFLSKLLSGGSANPRLDKLTELADFFGVSVAEIAGETEPEGLQDTQLWLLYLRYRQLKPSHRKMIDDHIGDLVQMIQALPQGK